MTPRDTHAHTHPGHCPRCRGTLFAEIDCLSCLQCGHVVYVRATPDDYLSAQTAAAMQRSPSALYDVHRFRSEAAERLLLEHEGTRMWPHSRERFASRP